MKTKFSSNIKKLLKSFINNKELFERRKYSLFFPIIFLIICIISLSLPSYIISKNIKSENIIKEFPSITEPMKYLLTSDLKCKVENSTLVCDENSAPINMVIEGENGIKYTIIANQKSIATDTTFDDSKAKDTDNLIIFFNTFIRIRYVVRDYVNETKSNEIIGDYTIFEGLDFNLLSAQLKQDPDNANEQVNNFILDIYKSTLKTKLYVTVIDYLVSFSLLAIISSAILKGKTLFRLKKGFSIVDCFKISLTSTFPALIISIIISLISMVDIGTVFGFIFITRIMFIYFKYIFPKNNIFTQIYLETKDERFNI